MTPGLGPETSDQGMPDVILAPFSVQSHLGCSTSIITIPCFRKKTLIDDTVAEAKESLLRPALRAIGS